MLVKLKIDESVSRYVVDICAAFGHQAHTVHDENLTANLTRSCSAAPPRRAGCC